MPNLPFLTHPRSIKELAPSEPYDLIFIDAEKSGYPTYLANILALSKPGSPNRLLRAGGLIIADNVLRRGIVADASDDNPHASRERLIRASYAQSEDVEKLKEYNTAVNTNERLEAWLLPLYDGVSLVRLRD